MKIQNLFLVTFLLILAACDQDPQNVPEFQLGQPVLAGSGCLNSIAHLNDNGTGVMIEFDEFQAEAGGIFSKLQRKTCSLAVPLDVPKDYQVAIVPGEVKGVANLKENSSLKISMTTFLVGKDPVESKMTLKDSYNGEFKMGGSNNLSSVEFSKCGESTNLRVNLSLLLKSKNKDEISNAQVLKFTGKFNEAFNLIWKKCE